MAGIEGPATAANLLQQKRSFKTSCRKATGCKGGGDARGEGEPEKDEARQWTTRFSRQARWCAALGFPTGSWAGKPRVALEVASCFSSASTTQIAELLFAVRALRREAASAASTAASWPPVLSTSAVELEAALGRGLATAWTELLKALGPAKLGALARIVERPRREVLGHVATALCGPSRDSLQALLATESEALPAGTNIVSALLAEGSFCGALLPALTIDAPEVEAWVREALSGEALDAVASLLAADRGKRQRAMRRLS
eukprot:s5513_g2.t1